MAYIKPEILKKVKQVDLLTYLLNYQPDRLKKISHNTYCIRDHDSFAYFKWIMELAVHG